MKDIENLRWQWIRIGYELEGIIKSIHGDDLIAREPDHATRATEAWQERLVAWRQDLEALLADYPAQQPREAAVPMASAAGLK
jgi:hypothetical protein